MVNSGCGTSDVTAVTGDKHASSTFFRELQSLCNKVPPLVTQTNTLLHTNIHVLVWLVSMMRL